ncbi:crotonyl-CoA carboxylase/reductase [Amycolatopsis orientalis]|uniref:Crotonyl-CoA carboxylase/reductase n=1 Tax=Amycolatopsis orientalis TaxID=31958 RepID=A0A193C2V1_AMYOR|nr:crotonyl-CoA carboxylase/reductase [Amycolatopsis orientalis]ANN18861.1 crotonyl-CoA carboxylase/reductase [Amycolatopsis orientalis]
MGKNLYDIGELPPVGYVPDQMHAQVIRQDRYGQPDQAFQHEVLPTPRPGYGQVLVFVMAAGINYNNVWAALGKPLDVIAMRQRHGAPEDFHIGGSDAAGIVWAVGDGVRQVKVGDEVVVSGCQWDERAADIRMGVDPIASVTQKAWGYESNYGSFAQFALVDEYQCHPKPVQLSWPEAACFMVSAATAYRQLCGWQPHTVQPGDVVLIWGGAGGLGSMAIQIVRLFGGIPVAVVSTESRADYCKALGAAGVINRNDFTHWGPIPDAADAAATKAWMSEVKRFRSTLWSIVGEGRNPRIVFEHSGKDTLPTSVYVGDNGGMIVICGATTGYHADIDLRFLWMRQKRLQGSHFANAKQCRAVIELVGAKRLDPCLSTTVGFHELGQVHQRMHSNELPPGNAAALINATE